MPRTRTARSSTGGSPIQTLAPGLPLAPSGRLVDADFKGASARPFETIKPMLFFRADERIAATVTNAGLRRFDQTWRLRELPEYPPPDRTRYRDEVILVARAPLLCDDAEVVTAHPASPSRLWLGELPAADRTRPRVAGVMTQETFLRVYVPVAR